MPNILPGLDNAWEVCFEKFKQFKDKHETKEYKEMAHGNGDQKLIFDIYFTHDLSIQQLITAVMLYSVKLLYYSSLN